MMIQGGSVPLVCGIIVPPTLSVTYLVNPTWIIFYVNAMFPLKLSV